ncbi:MAG: Ppx/GppA family phosphatase [Alphaproteobacteria bacterium]
MIGSDAFAASSSIGEERIAVVDIGSNSVRLTIYDLNSRVLIPQVNEKVFCGMGRQIATTGKLDPDGRQLAITALERFRALIRVARVQHIEIVATAAVRDASDGAAFKEHAEDRLGMPIRILDGDEEARLSALGVVAGIPDASGIVGDLGGGSLELVGVHDRKIGHRTTLPLGPLRLLGIDFASSKAMREHIDKELKRVQWMRKIARPTLYLVGGSWRSLARIHLKQSGERHVLKIPHQYTLRAGEARDFKRFVPGKKQFDRMEEADRAAQRREGLVTAAIVLERFIDIANAQDVVISAYGLREGIVAERQGLQSLALDPLLAGVRELCRQMARDPQLADELVHFTAPLFPWEPPHERRLRIAACWLCDIAWRVHPEYRANVAFWRVLGEQFAGLDHEGRVFLASVLYERYPGGAESEDSRAIRMTSPEPLRSKARVLGRVLRLGMTLSGGVSGTLPRCQLAVRKGIVTPNLPEDLRILLDDTVEKRIDAINEALQRTPAGTLLLGDGRRSVVRIIRIRLILRRAQDEVRESTSW